MSDNNVDNYFDIIKSSLSEASDTLALRSSLSKKIKKIAQAIEEATNNLLVIIDDEPNRIQAAATHRSSDRIISVRHKDSYRKKVIPLFGYSINKTSIFPVQIETELREDFASNEEELYSIITDIITRNSLKIMELIKESDYDNDIPF